MANVKQVSFNLPGQQPPLAAELRAAAEEQARLQALLDEGRGGLRGQLIDTGRFMVPDLTPIAQAVNQRRTAAELENAKRKQADLQGQYQRTLVEELRRYKARRDGKEVELEGPPVEGETSVTGRVPGDPRAFREFEGSPFPEVAGMAKADREAYQRLFDKLVERASFPSVQAAGGDVAALQPKDDFVFGNNAVWNKGEGGPPRVVEPVRQMTTPQGTLVNVQPGGALDAVDKAPRVSVDASSRPGNVLDKGYAERVVAERQQAPAWAQGLRATETAHAALREGARAGFGENFLQNARTLITGLTGVRFDASAPTGVLSKTLAENVLTEFGGKLGAGVSNADVLFMERAQAGLETDPKAIERILAIRAAVLSRRLRTYNEDVARLAEDERDPAASARRRAAYQVEIPRVMFGFITPDALASYISIAQNLPWEEAKKIAYEQPLTPLDSRASRSVQGSMGEEWRREPSAPTPEDAERERRRQELLQRYGGQGGR